MKIKDVNISNAYIVRLVRSHFRSHKQLLILSLADNAQLSLWQQGENQQQECLWQEAQDDRELEAWLRDVLLAHDVEEGAAMLIVLDDSLLQTEQLTLPKLPAKQLKKTLAWEAAQLFNFPQGSYSYCYKILAETADGEQSAQQVIQLWALAHAGQAEYVALAQRLMVKLEGLCVGVAVKQLLTKRLEAGEEETHNDDTLAEAVAQSWFAGEVLLLLPAVPRQISWRQCYGKLEQYLPRAAKFMAGCACLSFACSFGLHYLAQADLEEVQQEKQRYAVWQERQKQSVSLEKQLAKLKQQQKKRKPQTLASKELEQWGRLGLTNAYLTELEYKASSKQGRQQGLTVAQGEAVDGEALDALLDKVQAGKQYSSVQLVESQQQAGGVSFKLQLISTQE